MGPNTLRRIHMNDSMKRNKNLDRDTEKKGYGATWKLEILTHMNTSRR